MKKYLFLYVVLAIALSSCAIGNGSPTPVLPTPTPSPVAGTTIVPTVIYTNSPVPTATLVPTIAVLPTATETPFDGIVIENCPVESLGKHPDSGEPLIFKMNPYPGDANVLCEFEAFSLTSVIRVKLINVVDGKTVVMIAADWSHGTYNEDGTIKDACPIGWECEGTWVVQKEIDIPIGTIVHFYVYIDEAPAKQRFTETISWTVPTAGSMAPFACEYIAKAGHDMRNIRVPAWAVGEGTIYGFAFPLATPGHLTCPGYENWDPTPTP